MQHLEVEQEPPQQHQDAQNDFSGSVPEEVLELQETLPGELTDGDLTYFCSQGCPQNGNNFVAQRAVDGSNLVAAASGGVTMAALAGGAACGIAFFNPELWWGLPACGAAVAGGGAAGAAKAVYDLQDEDRCLSTCSGQVPPVADLGLWCGGCDES